MATYKKGILGVFSGKVGTVIGASWNGVDYMRSLPKSSGKAPSTLQMEQRLKFALVNSFLSPIKHLIATGYKMSKGNTTSMNEATSYHLKEAVIGTSPNFAIDFPKVVFSRGDVVSPWNALAASTVAAKINFTWTDNSGAALALATDKAVVVVYNPTSNQYFLLEGGATRADATLTVEVPPNFSGNTVHCWMAFYTANDTAASTSSYLGTVAVV